MTEVTTNCKYQQEIWNCFCIDKVPEFDVHGSVHLGNVYVQLKVQLGVFFCIL
jgi:hypothetical protein